MSARQLELAIIALIVAWQRNFMRPRARATRPVLRETPLTKWVHSNNKIESQNRLQNKPIDLLSTGTLKQLLERTNSCRSSDSLHELAQQMSALLASASPTDPFLVLAEPADLPVDLLRAAPVC
jgi:hypothetical protein